MKNLARATETMIEGYDDIEEIRRRKLEHLYLRKAAVENLIRSVEKYAAMPKRYRAPCIPIR